MKSIVLLSSGLDSTVAFKEAYDRSDEILCVTFDYGQRARKKELESAKAICERFRAGHMVISLPWFRTFRGALTGSENLPKITMDELDDSTVTQRSAEQVWVPARNVVFLSIGASLAENYRYDTIVTGFDAEEAATFPDNTFEFVDKFNDMLKTGTLTHPEIYAPLISLDKVQIIKRGIEIDAPLDLSWSCYEGKAAPCNTCESCLRRKRAFEKAEKEDPLFERLK
ncbi:MAG: 7-cyano-7-deazaguanine synthase QueC [Candidatus Methanoperedens sp.]|nr:7-cyano-7-deazaguanine synthase QueC [Candidatus Methanoperedens sp.]MCE8425864.1 7-cyano-7-deazaguanine synthase QueC [Candidatus Methanoperedens sp.]MCE8428368.1 7-cyano-7-deazaguanine synthase QueC [Candidatus Methanoperedens sp.]